jgi:hypothetical protein
MRIEGLTEGIQKLKADNKRLLEENATLKYELNLLKGVEFPVLAGKLQKALFKAKSRKDDVKDLIFKLEIANRSILNLEEDKNHIAEVKKTLEAKVTNLTDVLEKETASKEEVETKLQELGDTLVKKESEFQASLKVKEEE